MTSQHGLIDDELDGEEQLQFSYPRCWVMCGPDVKAGDNPEAWWAVGYYTEGGYWQPIIDYPTQEKAAAMVHYLNGGSAPAVDLDCIPKDMVEQRMLAIKHELASLPRDEKTPHTITVRDQDLYQIFRAHTDDLMGRKHPPRRRTLKRAAT